MKRKTWIIPGTVLAVAVVALFFVRPAEDKATADMVSRSERIVIPWDWTPEGSIVRREMFLCISTTPCPSIAKRWNTGRDVTVADLKSLTSGAGFEMNVEGTCNRQPNVGGLPAVCSSQGTDGEYDYTLIVTKYG